MISSVLKSYGIDDKSVVIQPLVDGLINRTWKITLGEKQYILQRINNHVFKKPMDIAENIRMIDDHLKKYYPGYLFVSPVRSLDQEEIVFRDNGYYRLFPFIKGSHTISVVATPDQAYEASFQFGKFSRLLSGLDATKLHITIPGFHDLSLRYFQFEEALKYGNPDRKMQSERMIADLKQHSNILDVYEKIRKSDFVKHRVMHHDTKISNILFDEQGKGICIIDLDTVMPGYFISDVGDMMRTYLSPVSEEEKDFSKIEVRDDFFRVIVQGYVSTMGEELTEEEQALIFYSGQFLIYMQALRFLTDYLNNDAYYETNYEEHNFKRAGNQMTLLKRLEEKREGFQKIISAELNKKTHFRFP